MLYAKVETFPFGSVEEVSLLQVAKLTQFATVAASEYCEVCTAGDNVEPGLGESVTFV